MKNKTIFNIEGEIHEINNVIDLKRLDEIELEVSPEGKPIIKTYIVTSKKVTVTISGNVIYKYYLQYLSGKEQEYFIK